MLLLLLIQLSGTGHAIHVQNDAGYVRSLIGSQECKSVGYIFGLPHAPQGNSLNHGLDDFLGNGLHRIRLRDTRRYSIYPDPLWPQFSCQRARHAVDRKLGCRVCKPAGLTGNTDHGRGVVRITPCPLAAIYSAATRVAVNTPFTFRSMTLS